MKDSYDVIVIGAGPAGSMAARTATEAGCSVLILEKRSAIGTPIRCAEGIGKQDLEDFIVPDPAWISAEIKRGVLVAPDGRRITVSGTHTVGYTLDRKLFDRVLAWNAIEAGAEIEVKTLAVPLMENGILVGVTVVQNGITKNVRARVVIAADGVESQFAKLTGINTTLKLSEIATCMEYLVTGIDIEEDTNVFYFSHEIAPSGYLWIFPKGKKRANIGIGIRGDYSGDGHRAKDYLDAFIQKHYPDGKILEVISGGVPVTRPLPETYGDNLLIAGDAAHVSDPMTGGGIYQALYTGRLAGKTAANAIHAGDTSKTALSVYDAKWRNSSFGWNLRISHAGSEFYNKLSDEQLNRIFMEFPNCQIENISLITLLKAFVKKNPKLLLHLPGLAKIFISK